MKKTFSINLTIEKLPEGYYVATSPDVQGLVAEAKTIEKVVEIAEDVAKTLLAAQKKKVSTPVPQMIYPLQVTI